MKCPHCGKPFDWPVADRLSIHGLYDRHLFHSIEGKTVDELIDNWKTHISKPIPALVDDRKTEDLGPSWFCPVIVLSGKKELRRVGQGIRPNYETRAPKDEGEVERFRQDLLSDPDIPRLLAEAR